MRSNWKRFSVILLLLAVFALALSGCKGGDGSAGATGATGATGDTGPVGPAGADKTTGTVSAAQLSFDDLKNVALSGKILSVDTSGNQPKVTFQVINKNTGEGIRGLRTFALHIAQLKPEANGSASYWLNYILTGTIPRPGADPVTTFKADGTVNVQGYSVVDNGDGTYVATFGTNIKNVASVPYDPTLTHRVVVGVRSVVVPGVVGLTPGAYAGPVNPLTGAAFPQFTNTNGANFVYDFTPSATGAGTMLVDSTGKQAFARDIVTVDACNQCHYKIQYGFPRGNNTSGHFGSRTDTKTCVICHTPQNIDPANKATLADFTPFIHKIHMGEELPVTEATFSQVGGGFFNEIKYPQDIRNCTWCHKGAVADSWKAKATMVACGSCHNNVDFATGANHIGGRATNDALCGVCHDSVSIALYHLPVTAVTNATSGVKTYYAENANLPTGAYKIEYVISSVTVDAARNVSVKFQIKKDGTAVNFGTYNAATNPNLIPNTTGGPSLRIAYNVTQDGITSPADTNAYMSMPGLGIGNPTVSSSTAVPPSTFTAPSTTSSLWVNGTVTASGITWTLTGPDATNAYTVKSSLPLPASTTMVTALMYGSMTQTNLTDYPYAAASVADFTPVVNATTGATSYSLTKTGLIISSANALKSSTSTGFTARRTIIDNAKCNACHKQLGIKPSFHGGGRNDGTDCHVCHTPNGNNGGWSYGANTFIHAIHGAALRTGKYTFQAASATDGYFNIGYPGLLKNCEMCHLSGTYDYTASASASAASNLLYYTVGTGTTGTAGVTTSPYIAQTAGTVYGSGFSYSTATGAVVTTEAAATTLVSSPISAACFSCHDSAVARSHMTLNGGSLYVARAEALATKETCLVCHGAANNAAFNETVPAIKTVHRWW